jgi:hypothetical protein
MHNGGAGSRAAVLISHGMENNKEEQEEIN